MVFFSRYVRPIADRDWILSRPTFSVIRAASALTTAAEWWVPRGRRALVYQLANPAFSSKPFPLWSRKAHMWPRFGKSYPLPPNWCRTHEMFEYGLRRDIDVFNNVQDEFVDPLDDLEN